SSSGGGSYSILGAASEKTVDVNLTIDGKDVYNHFQETANGVYQYAQILSTNENNLNIQRMEQEKLINQHAYTVNWDAREVAKDALSPTFQTYLDQMKNYECTRACKDYQAGFQAEFGDELKVLKDNGLEFINGKIVRSLTSDEKILLGQAEDYNALTDAQKKDFGVCFKDPSAGSCATLLMQEFDYSVDEVSNVVTLTKRISNGSIAG
ncbi:hypothetical protein P3G55_26670, partial [Leptospira sp. 96542]|nr:hypothetical protein [Leptospira sp. 96542]